MRTEYNSFMKRLLAFLCAVLFFAVYTTARPELVATAATQKQINDAGKKKEQAKKDAETAEAQKNAAIEAYKNVDSQISAIEDEIRMLSNQIETTKKDIEIKKEELRIAEEDLQKHKSAFMARARVMYEHKDIKYVELLFEADSLTDFLNKIDMITQILEYDDKVLDDLKETKQKIDSAKTELEDILLKQEEDIGKLSEKQSSLDAALAEKEKLMNDAIANADKYKAIYEAAEREEQRLINSNQKKMSRDEYNVDYKGGKFLWPVPGSHRITSRYGNRIHPVYKTKKFHTGIDIGAGYGLDIVASAEGKVTLATTNGGYGKCVIINHGSGISTLYAHCSSLLVAEGDIVKKGDVIAKVGSTGVSTGPHLHFEVRINGATTNPESYV